MVQKISAFLAGYFIGQKRGRTRFSTAGHEVLHSFANRISLNMILSEVVMEIDESLSADEARELEFELFNGNIDLLRLGKLERFYRSRANAGEWPEKECELQVHRIHDMARRLVSRSREGVRLIITDSASDNNFADGRKIIRFRTRD